MVRDEADDEKQERPSAIALTPDCAAAKLCASDVVDTKQQTEEE